MGKEDLLLPLPGNLSSQLSHRKSEMPLETEEESSLLEQSLSRKVEEVRESFISEISARST
jgi:hypothetical protein